MVEHLMNLYFARPASMESLRLGQWFCNAFKLQDTQLYYVTTVSAAKRIIAERYATYDHSFLTKYNSTGVQLLKVKQVNIK